MEVIRTNFSASDCASLAKRKKEKKITVSILRFDIGVSSFFFSKSSLERRIFIFVLRELLNINY